MLVRKNCVRKNCVRKKLDAREKKLREKKTGLKFQLMPEEIQLSAGISVILKKRLK